MEELKHFEKAGINYLKTLTEAQLSEMVVVANSCYYNQKEIITDSVFDILKEYIEKTYPENETIQNIGAPVEKKKVELPYELWSQNKLKSSTSAFNNWFKKYTDPKVVSAKLNGISALYTTEFGDKAKLFTRGNGKEGKDISHLIPYLNFPDIPGISVRGELLITKKRYQEKYAGGEYSNSLSWLVGATSILQDYSSKAADMDFVAYEVIYPVMRPSRQMMWLKKEGFNVVVNSTFDPISYEKLSDILEKLRFSYKYEVDGVIVTNNRIYERESCNPKHSFAFKMVLTDQIAEAKILDVIWTPSKDGYLKPRIYFEKVVINGVALEYATAFNAAYVENNNIGIGAIVKIIRSGDVIPHILDITVPAKEPKMPDEDYKWTDTWVDVILVNPEKNAIVLEKQILKFFTKLEIVGFGIGNVRRIMKAGFKTIPEILKMKYEDFLKVEGFKDKMATKVYEDIQKKMSDVTMARLMAASNLMGRNMGERRITLILNKYPNILNETDCFEKIKEIDGFAEKTAELFVKNIPKFKQFLEDIGRNPCILKLDKAIDKNFVLSGFRCKEIEKIIQELTGKPSGSTVNKNTIALITKDNTTETNKMKRAVKLNIPIILKGDFKKKYMKNI